MSLSSLPPIRTNGFSFKAGGVHSISQLPVSSSAYTINVKGHPQQTVDPYNPSYFHTDDQGELDLSQIEIETNKAIKRIKKETVQKPETQKSASGKKIFNYVASHVDWLPTFLSFFFTNPLAKEILIFPGIVLDIFVSTVDWFKKASAKKLQENWIADSHKELYTLDPHKLRRECLTELKKILESDNDFDGVVLQLENIGIDLKKVKGGSKISSLSSLKKKAQDPEFRDALVSKYSKKKIKTRERRQEFEDLLKKLAYSDLSLPEIQHELAEKGIQIEKVLEDEKISTKEEFIFQVRRNPKFKESLFHQYAYKSQLVNSVDDWLKRRQKAFEEKVLEKENDYLSLVDSLEEPLSDSIQRLKKDGIDVEAMISEKFSTTKELKTLLSSQKYMQPGVKAYVHHLEELAVVTRNAVKSLAMTKQDVEKSFFAFKLNKSRFAFASTLIISTAAIVVKALILAGIIAMPALAYGTFGAGVLAVGFALILLGTAYFIWRKPNVFKQTGTKIKLRVFKSIAAIPQFFYRRKIHQEKQNAAAVNYLRARLHELNGLLHFGGAAVDKKREGLEKLRAKISADYTQYSLKVQQGNEKIKKLERKINSLKRKIDPLEEKLVKAGLKDFVVTAGLVAPSKEGKKPQPLDVTEDLSNALAVLNTHSFADEEIDYSLKKQFGIDLKDMVKEIDPRELAIQKNTIKKAIEEFCSISDSQIKSFIARQTKIYEFGI